MTTVKEEVLEQTQDENDLGHAAHTKAADDQKGLEGSITRPLNITFLGAGSNFCARLCKDVMLIPRSAGGQFRLVDIDQERLQMMVKVVQKTIDETGLSETWSVVGTTNREEVLPGTDYMVCCVEVSGLDCVGIDNDIPLEYGIDQCIGDTIGPGGLFKALRTVPVFLDILRDARRLCPNAIMLNYTNPMNIMCLAAGRAVPEVSVVGLCHSVQGTSHLLADYAGVPYEEMKWECAGINHLAWFTRLEHEGKDLYQSVLMNKFKDELAKANEEYKAGLTSYDARDNSHGNTTEDESTVSDLVRKDMCVNFGAFITESSGHLSEYLPYYRKSEEGRKFLRLGYNGGSRFYATNWPKWRANADETRAKMVSGEEEVPTDRSWEYASWIIEGREKDKPVRIHGNVMNHAGGRGEAGKLITNLPGDGCVEVACMVDMNGINPTRYGALPAQMAHVCASNMAMFDLAATACIEKSKEAAIHALMLDPLTAAMCTPSQIREMTLKMFDAQARFFTDFK